MPTGLPRCPATRRALVADLVVLGVAAEVVDEAEIVVSELVGQRRAARDALPDGRVRVHWKEKGDAVEVEVSDGGGPTEPRPRTPVDLGGAGRGLRIVRTLAHEWGVQEDRAAAPCGSPSVARPAAAAPDRDAAPHRQLRRAPAATAARPPPRAPTRVTCHGQGHPDAVRRVVSSRGRRGQ